MARFQGKRVSRPWAVVLRAYENHPKRHIQLNSGRRTMGEQQHLVDTLGLYHPVTNPDGAAAPNPDAPHIWRGRVNHALDIDQWVGDGEQDFQDWLNSKGVRAINNVITEGWHLFVPDAQELRELAAIFSRIEKYKAKIARVVKKAKKSGWTDARRKWVKTWRKRIDRLRRKKV